MNKFPSLRDPRLATTPLHYSVKVSLCLFFLAGLATPLFAQSSNQVAKESSVTVIDSHGKPVRVESTTLILKGADAMIRDTPSQTSSKKQKSQPLAGPKGPSAKALQATAAFELGEIYFRQGKPEAIGEYEKAVKDGHGFACYRLGMIYQQGGLGVEASESKAMGYFEKGALLKDVSSLTELGRFYLEGESSNPAKAAAYFKQAVDEGVGYGGSKTIPAALLGQLYFEGRGVTKNFDLAVKYLSQPGIGSLAAMPLARLYLEKASTSKEASEASGYYLEAAERLKANPELAEAVFLLSQLYLQGKGVPQDLDQAESLLQQAADKGSQAAKFELKHEEVTSDFEMDDSQLQSLQKAAEEGSPKAQYYLGCLLLEGKGVKQDSKRGVALLKAAAEGGNVQAAYHLGQLHAEGKGVSKSLSKAFRYFQQGSALGDGPSALEAAHIYRKGGTGTPDAEKLIELYGQAASCGESAAHLALAKIYSSGDLTSPDARQAATHYLEAAKLGNQEAQLAVLKFYFESDNLKSDSASQSDKPSIAQSIRSQAEPMLVFTTASELSKANEPLAHYYLGRCYSQGIGTNRDGTLAAEAFAKVASP